LMIPATASHTIHSEPATVPIIGEENSTTLLANPANGGIPARENSRMVIEKAMKFDLFANPL